MNRIYELIASFVGGSIVGMLFLKGVEWLIDKGNEKKYYKDKTSRMISKEVDKMVKKNAPLKDISNKIRLLEKKIKEENAEEERLQEEEKKASA